MIDVLEPERANGRTHQARGGRGEHAVEERVVARHFVNALCARENTKKTDALNFVIINYIFDSATNRYDEIIIRSSRDFIARTSR